MLLEALLAGKVKRYGPGLVNINNVMGYYAIPVNQSIGISGLNGALVTNAFYRSTAIKTFLAHFAVPDPITT